MIERFWGALIRAGNVLVFLFALAIVGLLVYALLSSL